MAKQIKSKIKSKSILELSSRAAKAFFLKNDSYCNFDLPPYITFEGMLAKLDKKLLNMDVSSFRKCSPRDFDDVNHTILNNKDGKYAWRPLKLINPVYYVALVHQITKEEHWDIIKERFKEFAVNDQIECTSIPVKSLSKKKDKAEQVRYWWDHVEQKSIELAMDFQYLIQTDISDCYGAIYTHSIAWALHGKVEAKSQRRNTTLVGNIIDNYIQDISYGQTNGIPQGSVLMDFIAEMVLGYADLELSKEILKAEITDYKIIRYRDDYRIFFNNSQDGEKIVKLLTEVMIDLGLKLNPSKTKVTVNIIPDCIKNDKLYWNSHKYDSHQIFSKNLNHTKAIIKAFCNSIVSSDLKLSANKVKLIKKEIKKISDKEIRSIYRNEITKGLQKQLLNINDLAMQHPNSGTLMNILNDYHKKIDSIKKTSDDLIVLISIITNIAYHNPKSYPISSAILSKFISLMNTQNEKKSIFFKISRRFKKIPNTGYLQIWLQRITLTFDKAFEEYDEPLCKLISGKDVKIWNFDWVSSDDIKAIASAQEIINFKKIEILSPVIKSNEVDLFRY